MLAVELDLAQTLLQMQAPAHNAFNARAIQLTPAAPAFDSMDSTLGCFLPRIVSAGSQCIVLSETFVANLTAHLTALLV